MAPWLPHWSHAVCMCAQWPVVQFLKFWSDASSLFKKVSVFSLQTAASYVEASIYVYLQNYSDNQCWASKSNYTTIKYLQWSGAYDEREELSDIEARHQLGLAAVGCGSLILTALSLPLPSSGSWLNDKTTKQVFGPSGFQLSGDWLCHALCIDLISTSKL